MSRFFPAVLTVGIAIGKLYFDSLLAGLIISISLSLLYPEYCKLEEKKRKRELLLEFRDFLYSISASARAVPQCEHQ